MVFKIFTIVVTLIVWLVSNIFAIFTYEIIGHPPVNPQKRKNPFKRIVSLGFLNIISILVLFLLRFKFWYITLILSIFTILITVITIFFYLKDISKWKE